MTGCWGRLTTDRPDFSIICEILTAVYDTVADPVELEEGMGFDDYNSEEEEQLHEYNNHLYGNYGPENNCE